MIYFLLNRNNSFTIKNYLAYRGKALKKNIGIIYYDELTILENLACTTLIFSDLDLLTLNQLKIVATLFAEIQEKYPQINLINDPRKVQLRYELLRQLHRKQLNPHNVYRLSDSLQPLKFPVFLREENDHTGALSKLIYDSKTLEKNILALQMQGYTTKQLLIVEFVDTSTENGIYKKYAALKIGDSIFPRSLDYSRHWMVKDNVSLNKELGKIYEREFLHFFTHNPHLADLKRIFDLAQIDYGRIDYSFVNGKLIIWEINLNPDYVRNSAKKKKKPKTSIETIRVQNHLVIQKQFLQLDSSNNVNLTINVSKDLLNNLQTAKNFAFKRKVRLFFSARSPIKRWISQSVRNTFLSLASVMLYKKNEEFSEER